MARIAMHELRAGVEEAGQEPCVHCNLPYFKWGSVACYMRYVDPGAVLRARPASVMDSPWIIANRVAELRAERDKMLNRPAEE